MTREDRVICQRLLMHPAGGSMLSTDELTGLLGAERRNPSVQSGVSSLTQMTCLVTHLRRTGVCQTHPAGCQCQVTGRYTHLSPPCYLSPPLSAGSLPCIQNMCFGGSDSVQQNISTK